MYCVFCVDSSGASLRRLATHHCPRCFKLGCGRHRLLSYLCSVRAPGVFNADNHRAYGVTTHHCTVTRPSASGGGTPRSNAAKSTGSLPSDWY